MANVSFHHPRIPTDLTVDVNPDQIVWSYGLNTASFPTYGGEVVQVLSVYFDDITITGTVGTYAELERIYRWFITYMQEATQGRDDPHFDQHPVTMHYPERRWWFWLWPKSLPAFRYGRDVVAPQWSLLAAVKEPDAQLSHQLSTVIKFNASHAADFAQFGKATADFGTSGDLQNNPFASVSGSGGIKSISSWISQQAQILDNPFSRLLPSYQQNPGPDNTSKAASGSSPQHGAKTVKGKAKKKK